MPASRRRRVASRWPGRPASRTRSTNPEPDLSESMATTMEPETKRDGATKLAPAPSPAASGSAAPRPVPQPGGRRRVAFALMGVALLALAGLRARKWVYGLGPVSTDDAQVDGHIVPILPKVGRLVPEVRVAAHPRGPAGDPRVVPADRHSPERL